MDSSSVQVRERILRQAASLFVQRGFDGISMREIAEACAISKAGIYYHFKDKEELLLALMQTNLDHLVTLLAHASSESQGARAQLTRFAHALFTQMDHSQRAVIRLANLEMGKLSPPARAEFARRYQAEFIDALAAVCAAGVERGELRPLDPQVTVWVLLGILYPFFAPPSETRPETSAAVVDSALAIFFDGAAHEPG